MPKKKASTRAPAGKADDSDDEKLTESILAQSHQQLAIAQKKQADLLNKIEEMNRLNKKAAAEIENKEKMLLQTGASKEAAVVELALMRNNLEKAQVRAHLPNLTHRLHMLTHPNICKRTFSFTGARGRSEEGDATSKSEAARRDLQGQACRGA